MKHQRFNMSKLIIWLVVSIVLVCCCSTSAQNESMLYKDPNQPPAARVKDLLARMTLDEKIGQMTQIDRTMATPEVMKTYSIGSVLSGGGSTPLPQATAQDWMQMVDGYQKSALSSRLGIPMIYGIDAVHGHNNVDPDLLKRIGTATALEVRATGIPYTFAPCIAVCEDPRWGRCYESYSEDHKIVQEMTEIIYGLQGEPPASHKGVPYVGGKDKVAACAKHFVGDGGTTKGVNEANTVVDMHELLSIHMPAYSDSIIKGVSTVMVSYSSWNGVKMHANRDLITGFLKDTLKFKVMVPYNYKDFIDDLTSLVKNKYIPMERIDDAVSRILLVKFTMGLFESPFGDPSLANELGSQAHRDLAREAVRKSLVLLKNGKPGQAPVLPLPKRASKILVAGVYADNLGYQCGGWTINWQGFTDNKSTRGTTILTAVKSAVDPNTQVVYQDNPTSDYVKMNTFDYAIVVVGEPPYAETAGDSQNLTLQDPGPDVINNVCGAVQCVVIVISGRPLVIEPYMDTIHALVAAWLPGTEGQGVADVLFGDHEFTGKLARTWFKTVDQLPMVNGDAHYDPLFPLGFGLKTVSLFTRSVSAAAHGGPCILMIIVSVCISLYLKLAL
ncbi:Beta-glucosidase BoGH3B [Bienertia sinuspersici]